MIAHVYRSERKQDTYLYLRELDAFSLAPEAIVKTLQPLNFSFLALAPATIEPISTHCGRELRNSAKLPK